ncbi:MAG: C-GCAxxG-C-C family protein [Ignavibacteriales bacterium]|nr:C-GCAxxG-C-C family protein [Ignavibacteriales bacterium]
MPTDQANQVAINGQYLVHNYDQDLPQNISGSPLCHTSVTEWCIVSGKKVSDVERKERCARITGDVAAKCAEILNAFFAGSFVSTYVDPAAVTACLSCHGSAAFNNVMTKMDCTPCHATAHGGLAVEPVGGSCNYILH